MRLATSAFVGFVALISIISGGLHAASTQAEDWLQKRQVAFSEWNVSHKSIIAEIDQLKARTIDLAKRPAAESKSAARPSNMRTFASSGAVLEIWDSEIAPKMMIVPAGEYVMGTDPLASWGEHKSKVTFSAPFAISEHLVSYDEFAEFVRETNYRVRGDKCNNFRGSTYSLNWTEQHRRNLEVGYHEGPYADVLCIAWTDAHAYADWLRKKTGLPYRLLSEAEWEYTVRIGLIDNLNGNAEWVGDCWFDNDTGFPADGSSWEAPSCVSHVVRGELCSNPRGQVDRCPEVEIFHGDFIGFRVARSL